MAAMASCVMSAADVKFAGDAITKRRRPPKPVDTPAAGSDSEDDAEVGNAASVSRSKFQEPPSDGPFRRMATERLHAWLAKTFESRLAEGVWGPYRGKSGGTSRLRMFNESTVSHPTVWPPSAVGMHWSASDGAPWHKNTKPSSDGVAAERVAARGARSAQRDGLGAPAQGGQGWRSAAAIREGHHERAGRLLNC